MTKKSLSLADKVAKYVRAKESGGRAYKRADRLLKEIASEIEPGQDIPLNEAGRKAILHDRFNENGKDGKPVSILWQPCACRRFELEIIDP